MKNTILALVLLLTFVACEKKEDKPAPPVVPPIVEPQPPQPEPEQEYCKAEGKEFSCMSALYFYGKECPAQGPVYVKDMEEMKALVQKSGQAVLVKMKDGSEQFIGVGMPMPCEQL
jgi:hypothetical protein